MERMREAATVAEGANATLRSTLMSSIDAIQGTSRTLAEDLQGIYSGFTGLAGAQGWGRMGSEWGPLLQNHQREASFSTSNHTA